MNLDKKQILILHDVKGIGDIVVYEEETDSWDKKFFPIQVGSVRSALTKDANGNPDIATFHPALAAQVWNELVKIGTIK